MSQWFGVDSGWSEKIQCHFSLIKHSVPFMHRKICIKGSKTCFKVIFTHLYDFFCHIGIVVHGSTNWQFELCSAKSFFRSSEHSFSRYECLILNQYAQIHCWYFFAHQPCSMLVHFSTAQMMWHLHHSDKPLVCIGCLDWTYKENILLDQSNLLILNRK